MHIKLQHTNSIITHNIIITLYASSFYFISARGAKYCDACVCLSVRSHVSKAKCSNFVKFAVLVTCDSMMLRRQCNTLISVL